MKKMSLLAMIGLIFCLLVGTAWAGEINKMSKEDLLAKMQAGTATVVDVRTGRDWKSSEFKIKGAKRADKDIVKWAASYDKNQLLVLYCA